MPTKKKSACQAIRELPKIPKELPEQFAAELGHHLGYPAGAQRPEDETNQRNGKARRF
jgi:putative transposase